METCSKCKKNLKSCIVIEELKCGHLYCFECIEKLISTWINDEIISRNKYRCIICNNFLHYEGEKLHKV